MPQDIIFMIGTGVLHRSGFALAQRLFPAAPGTTAVRLLQRHKEGKIVEPGGVVHTEFFELVPEVCGFRRQMRKRFL
jgi:hypothetical protein